MSNTKVEQTAPAICESLISPNELDRNLESANVVDGLFAIARATRTSDPKVVDALLSMAAAIHHLAEVIDEVTVDGQVHLSLFGPLSIEEKP